MMRDEKGNFIKVYDSPKRVNKLYAYMLKNITDAKFGQLVNFGSAEKALYDNADEMLQELLDNDAIRRVDKDIYMVNPNHVGNGEWIDIYQLRNKYEELTRG